MKKTLDLKINGEDALIITDIQNDFLPGGALPVKEGDQIIPVINEYVKLFKNANAKIIASRDWHPSNHVSFTSQGGPWPPHCIQESEGAKFSSEFKLPKDVPIISKATEAGKEAYSVFDGTNLTDHLKTMAVSRIFLAGIATDYCVVNSVIDARKLKFDVIVLSDATRGINVKPGDVERAFETMSRNGAFQATLEDFPEPEVLSGVESPVEIVADKPLGKFDIKKKARMRSKGSYKRVRTEHG